MAEVSQLAAYDEAVSRMYALGHELANQPSHKFDLDHMRRLLRELGSPETKFPAVLIAGTNGKGSTAATLASILQAAGYRTGLYTSPHLVRINERVRVGPSTLPHGLKPGVFQGGDRRAEALRRPKAGAGAIAGLGAISPANAISDEDFARLHDRTDRAAQGLVAKGELPWHPSFFEMITAIAFQYFAGLAEQRPVDIAVLEVGMGGRLDATNVVEPLVSVIADIALDHQQYLGNTIAEIAREKAGIIRPGGIAVTLPQMAEANDALGHAMVERNARGVNATQYVPPISPGASQLRTPITRYRVGGKESAGEERIGQEYHLQVFSQDGQGQDILVQTPLLGRHQLRNVALAIAAAEELTKQNFKITAKNVEQGIRETRWPGRLQSVVTDTQEYLLDVAHNPAGAWALRSALSELFEARPLTFVFGAMRDKAISEMAEILFPLADRVIATPANNPRSASPDDIRAAAGRVAVELEFAENVAHALRRAREVAGKNGLVVVTGSIYIVGEAMHELGLRI
jgi:dihydrofolate synthase/folylpolyglutamate synthase